MVVDGIDLEIKLRHRGMSEYLPGHVEAGGIVAEGMWCREPHVAGNPNSQDAVRHSTGENCPIDPMPLLLKREGADTTSSHLLTR